MKSYMIGFSTLINGGLSPVMVTPGGRRFTSFKDAVDAMEREPSLPAIVNEIVNATTLEVVTHGEPDGRCGTWLPRVPL